MRLRDLSPSYYVRENGRGYLTIDCPLCGPPHRFTVPTTIGEPGEQSGIKRWNIKGSPPDWESVFIAPSVDLQERCRWHGTITSGNAEPSSAALNQNKGTSNAG